MNDDHIRKQAKQIVDKNPKLRALKSASNGEKPLYGHSEAGKGSAPRTDTLSAEWREGYDQIDWSKKPAEKRSFRMKVNGKYVDDE